MYSVVLQTLLLSPRYTDDPVVSQYNSFIDVYRFVTWKKIQMFSEELPVNHKYLLYKLAMCPQSLKEGDGEGGRERERKKN